MGVSENSGTPKSSILIGFSIRNYTSSILGYPYFRKPPYDIVIYSKSRIKKSWSMTHICMCKYYLHTIVSAALKCHGTCFVNKSVIKS